MKWSVLAATMILSAIFLFSTGRSSNITPEQLAVNLVYTSLDYSLDYIEPSFNEEAKEAIYRLTSPAFRRAGERMDENDILDEVDQLGSASDILSLTPDTLTGENKKLSIRLTGILTTIQSTDFPVLRKNYIKFLTDSLMKENIDVKCPGEVIVLEGFPFAQKEQVENYNTRLIKVLQKLRFSKLMYKWIRNDEDPASFDLSNASDRDVAYNVYH